MAKNRTFWWQLVLGYVLLLAGLFYFRNLHLADAGLPDFDSVTNFQVSKALAAGNFTNLFKHASPTFNLFLAAVLSFTTSFVTAEKLNGLLFLAGSLVISRFAGRYFLLKWFHELFLFALIGSSLTLTYNGRSLSLEGLGFLVFTIFFWIYYRSLKNFSVGRFYEAVLVFALLITINYKMLVLLPILVLIEIYQQQREISFSEWLKAVGLLILVFLFYSVLGWLLGVPFLRYLFVAGAVVLKSTIHPTINVPFFNTDFLFYFRYLFRFENPVLLFGFFAFPVVWNLKEVVQRQSFSPALYCAIFAWCLVLGMSLLQKAPRGILPVYPLLYLLTFLVFLNLIRKELPRALILVLMLVFNLFTVKKQIFDYSGSSYQELGAYLNQKKITKIAATASNRIQPFVPDETEVKLVFTNEELKKLRSEGYKYLIVDHYYKIGRIPLEVKFEKVVEAYQEKPMLAPIFALEHAEYSGMTYDEALEISESLHDRNNQLFLVEL